jgi:hypothetical protein
VKNYEKCEAEDHYQAVGPAAAGGPYSRNLEFYAWPSKEKPEVFGILFMDTIDKQYAWVTQRKKSNGTFEMKDIEVSLDDMDDARARLFKALNRETSAA